MGKAKAKLKLTNPTTQPEAPKTVTHAMVFKNLGQIIRAGIYPGELALAVSEAIKFCDQVCAAEEAKAEASKEVQQ